MNEEERDLESELKGLEDRSTQNQEAYDEVTKELRSTEEKSF